MDYREFIQGVDKIHADLELNRSPHLNAANAEQREICNELTAKMNLCTKALKVSPNLGEYMLKWNALQADLFFVEANDGETEQHAAR